MADLAARLPDKKDLELPKFVDRANVTKVTIDGEEVWGVRQEIPSTLLRPKVRQFLPSADGGIVVREASADEVISARAKSQILSRKTFVEPPETIRLPGVDGHALFFRVVRAGWFSARYVDVPVKTKKARGIRRKIVIDSGPGAAVLEPDHELYEGFREVKDA